MGCVNAKYYLDNCMSTDNNNNNNNNNNQRPISAKTPIRKAQSKKKIKETSSNLLDLESSPFKNYFNNTPMHSSQINPSYDKNISAIESDESERIKKIQNTKTTSNDKPSTIDEISLLKQIPFPQLTLQFISNINENVSEKAMITPNSLTKKDGNVIIMKDSSHKFSFGSALNNDYVLNDSNLSDKQFYTFYNDKTKSFHVVDSITGTGLFVQINDSLIITHDMIVSFCTDHMYLQVNDKGNQIKEIKVKFLQSNTQQEYAFSSDSKCTVTIGRGIKCDIVHDGESVSKVHCTLKYENGEWVLYDGVNTSKEKKKSTNGLWLLANVSIALKDGMTLKTGIYKIMVSIKEGVN